MGRLAGCAAVMVLAGCAAGVKKEDLETLRLQLEAKDDQMIAQLRAELTGVDQKYVTVQQLQLRVEEQLKKMQELNQATTELSARLNAKIDLAAGNVIRSLEFEERMMTERLAQLRSMIQELKASKKE